jgi:hypothetical protein
LEPGGAGSMETKNVHKNLFHELKKYLEVKKALFQGTP